MISALLQSGLLPVAVCVPTKLLKALLHKNKIDILLKYKLYLQSNTNVVYIYTSANV